MAHHADSDQLAAHATRHAALDANTISKDAAARPGPPGSFWPITPLPPTISSPRARSPDSSSSEPFIATSRSLHRTFSADDLGVNHTTLAGIPPSPTSAAHRSAPWRQFAQHLLDHHTRKWLLYPLVAWLVMMAYLGFSRQLAVPVSDKLLHGTTFAVFYALVHYVLRSPRRIFWGPMGRNVECDPWTAARVQLPPWVWRDEDDESVCAWLVSKRGREAVAWVVTGSAAVVSEAVQGLVTSRPFDPMDILVRANGDAMSLPSSPPESHTRTHV
ncbi:hypothetical protein AMAG_16358 [Allomyces macrogynus ATCC 38327]|uniref:Uncharacterized protein n=1 Tax=Allomyces macrogynus (strain ATCC 38327) TaxID=578462 RepID=A0A0L0TBI5_ALLM3|nr:hypothetical protein AMAG_16358 [Allomyces macrogynus ATCC 38327]|eukprot:KNE71934.1 hypothetical protein AMAG_16358 [Allomyces macrogynus ATCC 38327]